MKPVTYTEEQFARDIDDQIEPRIQKICELVIKETEDAMSEPKSGRVYRRKNKTVGLHVASAVGETPATDSGALVASMEIWDTGSPFKKEVVFLAPHAAILEGENGDGLRPFLAEIAERVQDKIDEL